MTLQQGLFMGIRGSVNPANRSMFLPFEKAGGLSPKALRRYEDLFVPREGVSIRRQGTGRAAMNWV